MDIQTGSIIYVKGHLTSLADDAIKLGEKIEDGTDFKNNYVHVCIYIGDGQVAEAQGGRETGIASFSSYANNCDIGELNWTPQEQSKIVSVAQNLYGLKYNWTEIAEIGIEDLTGVKLPTVSSHQFICSEYVKQVILKATGVLLSDKRFTTPEDISLYPKQHIVMYSKQ